MSRRPLQPSVRPPGFTKPDSDSLYGDLAALYRSTLEHHSDPYLERHSQPNSIRRQVDVFQRYSDFLPIDGTVLDWGCKHAPDSFLIRRSLGGDVRLLGYDFEGSESHERFRRAADLEFRQADHPFLLPYENESIDVVIGSGVLEHAVLPSQSLSELYRVVKIGGVVVITFLPNRLSWTEALLRRAGSPAHHRRLYTVAMIKRLLLDHGFEPQVTGHHQFVPAQRGGRLAEKLWRLNQALETAPPTKYFSANIYAIGVKRRSI